MKLLQVFLVAILCCHTPANALIVEGTKNALEWPAKFAVKKYREYRARKQRRAELGITPRVVDKYLQVYKGFFYGVLKANDMSLRLVIQCLRHPQRQSLLAFWGPFDQNIQDPVTDPRCESVRFQALKDIKENLQNMRVYLALSKPENPRGQFNPGYTETKDPWQYYSAKLNPHPHHLFNEWQIDFLETSDLPAIPKVRPLSYEEMKMALEIYEMDGIKLAGEFDKKSAVNQHMIEVAEKAKDLPEHQYNLALETYSDQVRVAREKYVNRRRRSQRKEYKKKYFEYLDRNPLLAMIDLDPIQPSADEINSRCREVVNSSVKFAEKFMRQRTKDAKENYRAQICSHLSKLPSYKVDNKSMEVYLMEAYIKALQLQKLQREAVASLDLTSDHDQLLQLAAFKPVMQSFVESFKPIQEEGMELANSDKDQEFNVQAKIEFERVEEVGVMLADSQENQELIEDFKMAGHWILGGVICGITVRRIPGAGTLLKALGYGICGVTTGLVANMFFYDITENRYLADYIRAFSSSGLATGNSHAVVLQEVSQLNERDTELFFESVFFFVGTGVGEALRPAFQIVKRKFASEIGREAGVDLLTKMEEVPQW